MEEILDLRRFPLDDVSGQALATLVERCRDDLDRFGSFDLDALVEPRAVRRVLAEVSDVVAAEPPRPARRQPVYPDALPRLPAGHPALSETVNNGVTVPDERLGDCMLARLYRWAPLTGFLARVLGKARLHPTPGGLTVSSHGAGQAAGWRFSGSEFKVRLLLQAPQFGGQFECVRDLRSDDDPNAEGVAALLAGRLPVTQERLMPGTLHVLRGRNTAQRVTTVEGGKPRIVAEFAYAEHVAAPARGERVSAGAV